MSRRKPWHPKYLGEYHSILTAAQAIERMSRLALTECLGGIQDMPLLEELVPLIRQRWEEIRTACMSAQSRKRQGERWPHWMLHAIEDATAIATGMETALAEMPRFVRLQYWPIVEQDMRTCHHSARQVTGKLFGGPPPEDSEVLRQAVEVIERYESGGPDTTGNSQTDWREE